MRLLEVPFVVMIEERLSALRSNLQKPDDLLFEQPYKLKILGLLLLPEHNHTVVVIVHLISALVFFTSIEIILNGIDVFLTVLVEIFLFVNLG